jgi:hypothetical protein
VGIRRERLPWVVPVVLSHRCYVDPGREHGRNARVSQIMQPDARQPRCHR